MNILFIYTIYIYRERERERDRERERERIGHFEKGEFYGMWIKSQ